MDPCDILWHIWLALLWVGKVISYVLSGESICCTVHRSQMRSAIFSWGLIWKGNYTGLTLKWSRWEVDCSEFDLKVVMEGRGRGPGAPGLRGLLEQVDLRGLRWDNWRFCVPLVKINLSAVHLTFMTSENGRWSPCFSYISYNLLILLKFALGKLCKYCVDQNRLCSEVLSTKLRVLCWSLFSGQDEHDKQSEWVRFWIQVHSLLKNLTWYTLVIFVFSPIFSLTVCAVLTVGLHIRKREI